jgi:hypothetical protein
VSTSGGMPSGLPEARVTPSVHSSLGPKISAFTVRNDDGPGVHAPPAAGQRRGTGVPVKPGDR